MCSLRSSTTTQWPISGGLVVSKPKKSLGNTAVIAFIVTLSFACALILSVLASVLKPAQETAKELDRSEQMLIAARIYNSNGYFQIRDSDGNYVPAKHLRDGILVAGTTDDLAESKDVLTVFRRRINAFLVDNQGNEKSFADAGLNEVTYTADNAKGGYSRLPLKLAYRILPNPSEDGTASETPEGYVLPINGFGLWDAIYGYLALKPDGVNVIGISWYDHKETPGLGAVISESGWQAQFPGKQIFVLETPGQDLSRLPVGITVVRGKVIEVIGTSPKSHAAVDGIPGATLTGNGVSKAYSDCLSGYRQFLIKINKSAQS
ncbi:Na(+)-translocating NADH-quinone reductase subunit C [Chlamydiales bacterium SCGC AG-110-P3]|nr:Na(+)-translocating NADH-quinone reductase subunit C [Chlamydiales bacterium SCGC AG-110-P3]